MKSKGEDTLAIEMKGMDTRLRPEPHTAALITNLVRDPGERTWTVMPGVVPITVDINATVLSLYWFQPRPNERYLVYDRRVSSVASVLGWYQFQNPDVTIATRRRVDNDLGTGETFLEHGRWLYCTSPLNPMVRWNGRRTVPVGFSRPAPPIDVFTAGDSTEDSLNGAPWTHQYIDRTAGDYENYNDSETNLRPTFITPRFWNVDPQRGLGDTVTVDDYNAGNGITRQDWRYAWGITVYNDLGQMSPMSPLSWAAGSNGYFMGRRSARIRIPSLPKNVQGVALWRSVNLAGSSGIDAGVRMYLVANFSTTHGFDYIDCAPDGELTIEFNPDEVGAVPQGARAMAFWQGSFWLGGMPDDPSTAYYSSALFVEQFPLANRIAVGSVHTGSIVAYRAVPRGLIVVKTGGIYIIKGNPLEGYHVEAIDETRGSRASRAIEFVPGIGLLFLHSSGPHRILGTADTEEPTKVESFGDRVADLWRRRVGGANISGAVSVFFPEANEVWFHLPTQGDARPDWGIVFHTDTNEWSVREDWKISCFAYYRSNLYCGSWEAEKVYQFTRGSATGAELQVASAVTGTYLTNAVISPVPFSSHRLVLLGRAHGSGATLEVASRANGAEVWTVQTVPERPQLHLLRTAPEWGTALWSTTEVYNDTTLTRIPVSLRVPVARMLQLRITSERMTLTDLELMVQTANAGPEDLERKS